MIVEELLKFATSRGRTLVELAVSWLAGRPTVASVIAGATSAEQVRTNARSAGWRLTAPDLDQIEAILSRAAQAMGQRT
jgi:aryl-alcohol dehydrogenase-like predicted oxidoreductase